MNCFIRSNPTTFRLRPGWRQPHNQSIISHLQNCSSVKELKQIHAQMICTRLIEDPFFASRIIAFLTAASIKSTTNMRYAHRVFDDIRQPNLFIWNSMIRGYAQNHLPEEALHLYKHMLHRGFLPDGYTYTIVVMASARLHAIGTGKTIHGMIVKCGFESDMYVMSGFVKLYATCDQIEVAREIFEEMPERDIVAWTSMISEYAQSTNCKEAFTLFEAMRSAGMEPNNVTLIGLVKACGQLEDLERGRWLHSFIVDCSMERDVSVCNSLISMYSKCGSMSNAAEIFDCMPVKNVVSWNALIGGFVKNGQPDEALSLFHRMLHSNSRPDGITFVNALSACAQLGDLEQGKLINALIVKHTVFSDVFVMNALVNMYAKCGDLQRAACIFHEMPEQDIVSWTAMISGYVQARRFNEALALFEEMQISMVQPNEMTLVSVLSACSQLGSLDQGKQIHSYIEDNKVKKDVHLGNSLVDMYAKCGCIERALCEFRHMPCKDIFSWNAMIGGLANHGRGEEAINLFNDMQRAGEIRPDHVTFLLVLSACAHSGMVQEGYHYFSSMSFIYGIIPKLEHYGCMVDLLTRAGQLDEARDFMMKMPIEPNYVMWGSLLAACRVHGRVNLAEKVAQQIKKLAPDDHGPHVLISNIYAEEGRWDDVGRVRIQMDTEGILKSPGSSSVL